MCVSLGTIIIISELGALRQKMLRMQMGELLDRLNILTQDFRVWQSVVNNQR